MEEWGWGCGPWWLGLSIQTDSLWLLRPDLGQRKQRRVRGSEVPSTGRGGVSADALASGGNRRCQVGCDLSDNVSPNVSPGSWLEVGLQEWACHGLSLGCDM